MMRLCVSLIAIGVTLTGAASASEAELLKYAPASANSVAIVRVREILKTPRAKREGWEKQREQQFLAGTVLIPPWVDTVVSATKVLPGGGSRPWTVAIQQFPKDVSLTELAEQNHSQVQQLSGKDAIALNHNAYLVSLAPKILAAVVPGHRQEIARWLQSLQAGLGVSDYLNSAAESKGHVVLALDLYEAIDPTRVQEHLAASPAMKSHTDLIPEVAELLTNMRGMRLSLDLADPPRVDVSLDFASDAGKLAELIKPLFLEALHQTGADLEELHDSEVSIQGNSVVLSAAMTDEGLQRIFSLVALPSTGAGAPVAPQAEATQTDTTPAPSARTAAEPDDDASKEYFRAIDKMLKDLTRANRKATDYAKTATWHDRYANKIDELPMDGVDQQVLDYGGSISSKLRALAASLRGVVVNVNAQESSITYDVQHDPGWGGVSIWGGVGWAPASTRVTSNLQDVRTAQSEAIMRGAQEREQIWQMINDERSTLARQLKITLK